MLHDLLCAFVGQQLREISFSLIQAGKSRWKNHLLYSIHNSDHCFIIICDFLKSLPLTDNK